MVDDGIDDSVGDGLGGRGVWEVWKKSIWRRLPLDDVVDYGKDDGDEGGAGEDDCKDDSVDDSVDDSG